MNAPSINNFDIKRLIRNVYPCLLILPALLPLILLIVFPAIKTLIDSFYQITFGLPNEFIGFNNYIEMGKDPVFWRALGNTVMFSFAVVAGEILLGLVAALLLLERQGNTKIFVSLIIITYAVSDVVAVIMWKYMLDPDVGIINYIFHVLMGFDKIEWASNPRQAWWVIIIIRIWTDFPFSFLIIYSALMSISVELYEAAYIDGASKFKAFHYITIPLAKPAIMVSTIFNFVFAFRNFSIVWVLTGGGPMQKTELLSTLLYRHGFSFWEFGSASAISMSMTIITFIISIYYLKTMYRDMFSKN